MPIAAAVLTCLSKSFDFRGRAPRREFWIFLGFWLAIAVACSLSLPPLPDGAGTMAFFRVFAGTPALYIPLVLLLPLAAVAVRRLHDIGVSGWWLLSASAPVPVLDLLIIGAQIVCFAKAGTTGPNRYGPDPRQT